MTLATLSAGAGLGQHVDAAEHQPLQAVGDLDVSDGRRVARVDAEAVDEADQLLEVERIALGSGHHQLDQLGGHDRTVSEQLAELPLRHEAGLSRFEGVEDHLGELGEAFQPEPAPGRIGRAVGDEEEHRQIRGRSDEHFEQVAWTADRASGSPPPRSRPVSRWLGGAAHR